MVAGTETFDYFEAAKAPDEIGRLGPYRVLSSLGRGGMGQVFLAEDTRLERVVALKVMNKRFATTPNSRERFIREARSMAAIKHDNVVTVYEVGEHAGIPFMAMELLKGKPLEALIQSGERLSIDQAVDYAIDISRGLAAAHSRGIVHRDIKPANIWIEEESGRIKILDFGLALASAPSDTMTARGAVVGTPGYLSPEQAQGDPLDDRSDLYSLGVVMYELIAGKVPFEAKTVPELLIRIIAHLPRRIEELVPNLPQPYADLIMRLLAKEPRERIRSASELEQQLFAARAAVQDQSSAALRIVTDPVPPNRVAGARNAVTPGSPLPTKKESPVTKIPLKIWVAATAVSATLLFVFGSWYISDTKPVAQKPMVTRQEKTERVVMAKSLDPLRLQELIAGSPSLPVGELANFRMQLMNAAADGTTDPRVLNSGARVVAQVRTYLQRAGEAKRPAPAFPKKMSASQLPSPKQSSVIEVQFTTAALLPGEYRVTFELQSPTGTPISEVTSQLTVLENLATTDLLGFEILRTSKGRGADTTLKSGSPDDLGGRPYLSVHRQTINSSLVTEHVYLRFDLKAQAKASAVIDRVILLLTLDKDGLRGESLVNAYGVPEGFSSDWSEKGESRLIWDKSPSAQNIESFPFLGQAKLENSDGAMEQQTDTARIFGTGLDDYIRQAGEQVTILLVRTNEGTQETRFRAREGSVEQAPALAIRYKN